jgi:G:T/U-mismatch repair DNA glycosylase
MKNDNNKKTAEHHPLKPFLPGNAKMLLLGSFPPPPERWTMPFYYPNFQNDMWRIFGIVFFNDKNHFVSGSYKSFDENGIKLFLTSKGIALYDTAIEIVRQKGNASDQFLNIVQPIDLQNILTQIPKCHSIVTTGQKATETLMNILGIKQTPPLCGYVDTNFMNRKLRCWRMPSSSRAYPRALPDKADDYRQMFEAAGFL